MTATLPADIFNIGDRVSIVSPFGNPGAVVGTCGTIVYLCFNRDLDDMIIGVDHDVESGMMHDCTGNARNRHGWLYPSCCLKIVDHRPSVVDVDIGAFV